MRWTLHLETACGCSKSVAWGGDRPPRDYRVPLLPAPTVRFAEESPAVELRVEARRFELVDIGVGRDGRYATYRESL